MADGVNISRGNPRSSSVSEEEDISEVRYRSTSALDPSQIVEIEDCGIPLDCGSSGDSFGSQNPCDNLDLTFYNVMGQEDRFRQIDGVRADRGGTARIVFTAVEDVVIEKIDYAINPSDEDNPTFTDTWTPNPPAKEKHEVFVNVSPDSFYAFKITISVDGCPDTNTSGIYYFFTGDDVVFKPEGQKIASPLIDIKVQILEIIESALPNTTTGVGQPISRGSGDLLSSETLAISSSISSLQKSVSVSTSFSTS